MRHGRIGLVLLVAAASVRCAAFGAATTTTTGTDGGSDAAVSDGGAADDGATTNDAKTGACTVVELTDDFEHDFPGKWTTDQEGPDAGVMFGVVTQGANNVLSVQLPSGYSGHRAVYKTVAVTSSSRICVMLTMTSASTDLAAWGAIGSSYADLVTIDLIEPGGKYSGYANLGLNKNGFFFARHTTPTNTDSLAVSVSPLDEKRTVALEVDLAKRAASLKLSDGTPVIQVDDLYVTSFDRANVSVGAAITGTTGGITVAYDDVTIASSP